MLRTGTNELCVEGRTVGESLTFFIRRANENPLSLEVVECTVVSLFKRPALVSQLSSTGSSSASSRISMQLYDARCTSALAVLAVVLECMASA